ncbi:MAG TPA: hemolysin family protein [Promineifilum sp.]|nr:hemolysin family protein [Promineifilum sp.]HQF70084.1 hemolysin family protein [Promineifilum sp.]
MTKLALLLLGLPGVSFFVAAAAAGESLPSFTVLIVPAIVIFVLVIINGVFVAAEFAIIGVRDTQMEQMADEGNSVAGNVLQVLELRPRLDHYIATAQLGITLASLGLAMYGEPAISHFIEPYLERFGGLTPATTATIGYIVALSLMTYLHVVVGEMVPKALALSDASSMAIRLDPLMRFTGGVLKYPVHLLNAIGNRLLRLLRIPPAHGEERLVAADELELIVAESAEGGLIKDEEEEFIRNIFDFSERTVGQVMTPRRRMQALDARWPQDELIRIVTESRHSRFPVYENDLDHIVGILHLKDLLRLTLRPNGPFDLRLILRAAPEVPEDYRVDRLLAAFKKQKLHMAVVRDEFGGLAGVVTLEDLVEEVVGEVRDEFDQEREPRVELGPGVLDVAGDYLLDDLAEEVFLGEADDLPDVETVGGLIVALLGRPPLMGDTVALREVHFTVLDIDRLAVLRAKVEFPSHKTHKAGGRESETDKEEE